MTKLELNASYEDARKLGECFVRANCETNSRAKADEKFFLAVDDIGFWVHHFNQNEYCEVVDCRVITLDLTTCQPNIYKCIECGFKVEVAIGDITANEFDLSNFDHVITLLHFMKHYEIKSIKILDLDKMEGVKEVEV